MVDVLALTHETPLSGRIVPLLLAAAAIAVGVGLMLGKRWAWLFALLVLIVDVTLVGGILRLLVNLGLVLLLVRPRVRARFGMR